MKGVKGQKSRVQTRLYSYDKPLSERLRVCTIVSIYSSCTPPLPRHLYLVRKSNDGCIYP